MNNRFKRFLSLGIIVVLSLTMMIGCTGTKEVKRAEKIVVTDQMGREVEVPGNVERIVSSYYITSSLLIALESKERVVGLEVKADTREIYKKAAPEFLNLPAVGSGKTFNIEECLELKPDLVIIPLRLKEFLPKLEELNIPVLVVDPESMESFIECIELLGKAINKEDRAKELVDYYKLKMDMVVNKTKDIKDKPKVYLSAGSSPLSTCTSKMYQNDLIHMAGGDNVSKGLEDGYWATISAEELVKWNPDYIFMVGYASYTKEDIINDDKFKNLNGVKNDKVFVFPSKIEPWDYPTPSSVLGILWLVNKLHPDIYPTDEYVKEGEEFYKKFFNIEVSKEDMGL